MAAPAPLPDGRTVAETHPEAGRAKPFALRPLRKAGAAPAWNDSVAQADLAGAAGENRQPADRRLETPQPARGQRSRDLLCGWLQGSPQEDSVTGPLLGFIVCCHLEVAVGALGKLHTWSRLAR